MMRMIVWISIQMNVLGSMEMCKIARYKCTGVYDSGYAYRNLCQKVKCGGERYKFQCTDHSVRCKEDSFFSIFFAQIFKHTSMKECPTEKYDFKADKVQLIFCFKIINSI